MMDKPRDAYALHMDELTMRISDVIDGEDVHEVAMACAVIIGFAVAELAEDRQKQAIDDVTMLIARTFIAKKEEASQ